MFQNIRCTCAYSIFGVVIFGKITRVLGTVCENLLLYSKISDACTQIHVQLVPGIPPFYLWRPGNKAIIPGLPRFQKCTQLRVMGNRG